MVEWLALVVAVGGWVLSILLFLWGRRSRRQDLSAAQKRARLDERFEPVRRYAMALDGFVRGAARYMRVWGHVRRRHSTAADLAQLVNEHWARTEQVMPRPERYSLVDDALARASLDKLHRVVWRCHDRCLECLQCGELMTEDEANGYVAQAHEHLELLLARMDGVVDRVHA